MPDQVLQDGDVALIEVFGQLFGQTTVTTFWYRWIGNELGTTIEFEDVAEQVWNEINTAFANATSEDWFGSFVRVSNASPVSTVAAYAEPITEAGAVAQSALPPSVCGVITRRTGLKGPKGRGRIYVPAVPTPWNDDGFLAAAGITAYTSLADAMDNIVTVIAPAGTLVPGVYSRTGLAFNPLTSTTVQPILRQQRRRELGVGI